MTEWNETGRWVINDCPEYLCEFQEYRRGDDQMIFIHATTENWSKHSFKKMHADFNRFRSAFAYPIYAVGDADDRKWVRFVTSFGFKPLTDAVCTDGKRRRIFIHFKDGNINDHTVKTRNAVVPIHEPVVGTNPVSDASVSGCSTGADECARRDGSN